MSNASFERTPLAPTTSPTVFPAFYYGTSDVTRSNNGAKKNEDEQGITPEIKVYKKRWTMLIIFMLFSTSNTVQNVQYSVVANVIKDYYDVSYFAIDWTTMLPSLLMVIFTFPGTFMLDKLGLRKTLIIGTVGTAVGTLIKVGSVHPNRFWVVLLGHGVVSLCKICFAPVLPKLTATWFGYQQVATATGLGVAGFNGGTSLSFLLPTLIVTNGDRAHIEKGLYVNTLIYFALASLMVPLVLFFFSEKPDTPPSYAQENFIKARESNPVNFLSETKAIFANKEFLMFVFINAVNASCNAALENLSNQIIISYYPKAELHVGIAGVLHVLSGLVGSIICSMLLDKFKKFKLFTYIVYGSLGSTFVLFATTVNLGLPMVYISLMLMGFFFGSSEAINMEVIIELTYPQSQNVTAGFSSVISQLFAFIFTYGYGTIHRSSGNIWSNVAMISIIICADLLFFLMKFNLRRTAKEIEK